MSLYQHFKSNGPSGFGYGSTAEQVTEGLSLDGKTILVTGCNSGLGQEALRVLVLRGARVIGTARTLEKAKAACDAVKGKTVPVACELSDRIVAIGVQSSALEIPECAPAEPVAVLQIHGAADMNVDRDATLSRESERPDDFKPRGPGCVDKSHSDAEGALVEASAE